MRELLFRGKNVKNGEWVKGNFVEQDKPEYHAYIIKSFKRKVNKINFMYVYDFDCTAIIPETIGQYTGLRDKNGTRIFEGDIIKQIFETEFRESSYINIYGDKEDEYTHIYGYHIGETAIIPSKGTCMKNPYRYMEINGEIAEESRRMMMYKNIITYRCEVIGNIYDNPELLEVR